MLLFCGRVSAVFQIERQKRNQLKASQPYYSIISHYLLESLRKRPINYGHTSADNIFPAKFKQNYLGSNYISDNTSLAMAKVLKLKRTLEMHDLARY